MKEHLKTLTLAECGIGRLATPSPRTEEEAKKELEKTIPTMRKQCEKLKAAALEKFKKMRREERRMTELMGRQRREMPHRAFQ